MKGLAIWLLTTWVLFFQRQAAAQDYTFTTIAGVAGGIGSNDGTNSDARFNFPAGITVDRAGNLYVAEILNHTIRKLTPSGTNWIVSTLAGLAGVVGDADGTNSDARFDRPNGVTVDESGNLFVADHYSHTIRKITPVGSNWVVSTLAGLAGVRNHNDGTNSDARFYSPTDVSVDSAGRLYVTDTANFTIRGLVQVGSDWVVTTLAGLALNYGFVDGVNDQAEFDYPNGLTVNRQGAVYIADWGNHAIRQMSRSGSNWVVDTIAGFSGNFGSTDGAGRRAEFYFPNGITVDAEGVVYVADQNNHTIRRLTPPTHNDWTVSTIGGMALQYGSADGTGSNARFYKPWGVTVDRAGNLFVTDYDNQTIRKGVPPWGPIPTLQIQISTNQVILSWPVPGTNYLLESSSVLSANASWIALTNGIVTNAGTVSFAQPLQGPGAFYRLRRR